MEAFLLVANGQLGVGMMIADFVISRDFHPARRCDASPFSRRDRHAWRQKHDGRSGGQYETLGEAPADLPARGLMWVAKSFPCTFPHSFAWLPSQRGSVFECLQPQ